MSCGAVRAWSFGGSVRADMGQSRGAQSGEADRHAVWLSANNLETRLSPFDPWPFWMSQRLVRAMNFHESDVVG